MMRIFPPPEKRRAWQVRIAQLGGVLPPRRWPPGRAWRCEDGKMRKQSTPFYGYSPAIHGIHPQPPQWLVVPTLLLDFLHSGY